MIGLPSLKSVELETGSASGSAMFIFYFLNLLNLSTQSAHCAHCAVILKGLDECAVIKALSTVTVDASV